MKYLSVCIVFCLLALPVNATGICDARHYQTKFFDDDLKRFAMAHVYAHGSEAPYWGNAFVVDTEHRLAITAFHVVKDAVGNLPRKGDLVDMYFPAISTGGTGTVVPATVLERLQLQGGDRDDIVREDVVRDLALLQMDQSMELPSLQSFRLGFEAEQYSDTKVLSYFGGVDDASEFDVALRQSQVGRNRLAACKLEYFSDVGAGDSGGPVVEAHNARAVGMVLSSRVVGDRVVGEVLPFHCTRQVLNDWMVKNFDAEIEENLKTILEMNQDDLASYLQGALAEEKVSNLTLMAMVSGLADDQFLVDVDQTKITSWISEKLECPLLPALSGRQIGVDGLVPGLVKRIIRQASLRDAADDTFAIALREPPGERQTELTRQAVLYYRAAAIDERQKIGISVRDGTATLERFGDTTPKTFKGLADALYSLALQTEAEEQTLLLTESAQAALTAAALGQQQVPEVSAQALTTYASAASRLRQYDSAAQAWATAWANGAQAEWVRESYDFDVSIRDGFLQELNQNYIPIERASEATPGDFARELLTERQPEWLVEHATTAISQQNLILNLLSGEEPS